MINYPKRGRKKYKLNDVKTLLDYERIRFDRVYNHLVATAERFSMIAATASLLVLGLVTMMCEPTLKEHICSCPTIRFLYIIAIGCIGFSIILCLCGFWMRLEDGLLPPARGLKDKRIYDPTSPFGHIEKYVKSAKKRIKCLSWITRFAGISLLLGFLLTVVILSDFLFKWSPKP